MKKSLIYLVVISILVIVIMFLTTTLTGKHPIIKLFLTSPKEGKVLFSNIGAEDALVFGSDFEDKRELVKALIAYNYAVKKDNENIDANTAVAKIYSEMQNYEEAKKYIEKAINHITSDTPPEKAFMAYYGGGVAYYNSTKYEGKQSNAKALEYFEKAIDISKSIKDSDITELMSDIYYCMGDIYLTEEQYDKAAERYIKSLEIEPEDAVINFNVAVCYIKLSDLDEAYKYIEKTKMAGKELQTTVGLIFYYTEKGEMDKALEYIKEADQKFQNENILDYYKANFYAKQGDINKAKEIYEKLFEINPYSIFTSRNQKIIQRYNIDISHLVEKIEKEKEEKYSYKVVKE